MAFSDLIDTPHPAEPVTNEAGAVESAAPSPVVDPGDTGTEKRVALPKPDTNNITVLTESLPNEPILPWHHFDSPWLEKEEMPPQERPDEVPLPSAPEDDSVEQLALALDSPLTSDTAGAAPPTSAPKAPPQPNG